jgi:uncharacterized damage-inducible protein DinB
MSIHLFYDQWQQYNRRIVEVIAGMSAVQLEIRPSPDGWPIWATVGHTAGVRVYWLCDIVGEPGASETPFQDSEGLGWEDDLDTPRSAAELTVAMDSTWNIIEGCLDRWSSDTLGNTISRRFGGTEQIHTLGSILQRLFSHDAYHCGELSQTLGINGLVQIDLWRQD